MFSENRNRIGHQPTRPCSRNGDRNEPRASKLLDHPLCARRRPRVPWWLWERTRSAVWAAALLGMLLLAACRPTAKTIASPESTTDGPTAPAPTSPEIRLEYSSGWGSGYVLELDAEAGKWHFTDRETSRRQTAEATSAATDLTCFIKALEAIPEPSSLNGIVDGSTYRFTVNHGEKQFVRSFGRPSRHFMYRATDGSPSTELEKEFRDAIEAQKKEAWEELRSHWTAFYLEMEIDRVLAVHFPDSGFSWKPMPR